MIDFVRTPRRVRNIQLTSLIDVTFLLLKFFILTSSFSVIESLDLSLPAFDEAPGPSSLPSTTIDLLANGAVYVDGRTVWQHELQDKVALLFRGDAERKVLIRCESGVVVQRLVDMMDIIHLAGGKNVSVYKWDKDEEAAEGMAG